MSRPRDHLRSDGIEHQLIKPNHPWTNGQAERMEQSIKEAIIGRIRYGSHEQS